MVSRIGGWQEQSISPIPHPPVPFNKSFPNCLHINITLWPPPHSINFLEKFFIFWLHLWSIWVGYLRFLTPVVFLSCFLTTPLKVPPLIPAWASSLSSEMAAWELAERNGGRDTLRGNPRPWGFFFLQFPSCLSSFHLRWLWGELGRPEQGLEAGIGGSSLRGRWGNEQESQGRETEKSRVTCSDWLQMWS